MTSKWNPHFSIKDQVPATGGKSKLSALAEHALMSIQRIFVGSLTDIART